MIHGNAVVIGGFGVQRGVSRLICHSILSLALVIMVECLTIGTANASNLSMINPFGNASAVFPTNSIQVTVVPVGNVSKASVREVNDIITKYDIVGNDARNVAMGANQPIHLYVAGTASDYKLALQMIGVSLQRAASLSSDTAGFTMGGSVVVPLFQNQDIPDLANTIAHELTHAIFNLDIGPLPSWLNEGLAVSDGMYTQARVEGPITYGAYARQMAGSVLDAVINKRLMPLASDESAVYNAPYDVELQDWLSVQYLIRHYGYPSILSYFARLKLGETDDFAFLHTYGMSFETFNSLFTQKLKAAARAVDPGVRIIFSIPSSFHGTLRILQHGIMKWQDVALLPGTDTIQVTAKGSVSGGSNLSSVTATGLPDAQTMYIDVACKKPWLYHGMSVTNSGFAINYMDGLYGYGDAWVTLSNGQTLYLDTPSLFHVQLLKVSEVNSNQSDDPVLTWISALSNQPKGR